MILATIYVIGAACTFAMFGWVCLKPGGIGTKDGAALLMLPIIAMVWPVIVPVLAFVAAKDWATGGRAARTRHYAECCPSCGMHPDTSFQPSYGDQCRDCGANLYTGEYWHERTARVDRVRRAIKTRTSQSC